MAKATNKRVNLKSLSISLAAALILPSMVLAAPSVVTQMYDNGHTGWNRNETQLTVANVKAGFKLLFKNATDGGTYSQPLYIPGLKMGASGTHNVIFFATENNTVYAFDADVAGPPLWSKSLTLAGETLQTASDYNNTRIPAMGVTGTPVIDPISGTIYAVAASKTLSVPAVFHQRLHALDISTGNERPNSPVDIQAKYPGTGGPQDGNGNVVFDPRRHFNHNALLLFANNVYIAFGSHEDVGVYQGWVMAYDKTSLAQVAVFNTSPNLPAGTGGGSIWQARIGMVADSTSIYGLTANGLFDANTGGSNYGDTALRLGPTLNVEDYFTPCDQGSLNAGDHDLGSGGAMVLPVQTTGPSQLLTFAGKEGSIYLTDRTDMGGFTPSQVPYTEPCTDHIVQKLWRVLGTDQSGDDEYWGAPAYFQDFSGHQYVYYTGDYSPIREFDLANGGLIQGTVAGKPNQTPPHPPYDFPHGGTIPEISSNGGDPATAILWALRHAPPPAEGDGPLTLDAFAATDLTNQLVFDIPAGSWTYQNDPFLIPTIANGKVYVASAGELDVFGPSCISILSPPANSTVSGVVALPTNDSCNGVHFEGIVVDGVPKATALTGRATYDTTALSNGPHTFAIDSRSANPGSTILDSASVVLNVTKPCISILSPPNYFTVSGVVALPTSDICPGVWFESVQVDGIPKGTAATGKIAIDTTTLSGGLRTFTVNSQSTGPGSTILGGASVILNVSHPCISILSPPANSTVSGVVALPTSDVCPGAWFETIQVDGIPKGAAAKGKVTVDTTTLSSGPHTFTVNSRSSNPGSTALGGASVVLNVSHSCISILSPPANSTVSGVVALPTSDVCPGVWFESIQVDGVPKGAAVTGKVTFDTSTLSSGPHTFTINSQSSNPGSTTLGSASVVLDVSGAVVGSAP